MASLHTYEGTWEEIRSREDELAGHRVRVTVVDDSDAIQDGFSDYSVANVEWATVDFNV